MDWRWLRSGEGGPAWNMALDEALLRSPAPWPTLRTYRWDPWALSLGYFQEVDRERVTALAGDRYGIVRRPTGGRTIFHGPEITYSVCWPLAEGRAPRTTLAAYDLIHGALATALARLGVSSATRGDASLHSDTADPGELYCFYESSPFDLVVDGRKLVGSAQRRSSRGFLQHGSIPVGPNPLTPEAAWARVDPGELEEAFAEELGRTIGVAFVPGEPTPGEWERARDLERERYARDGWTWRRVIPDIEC